MCLKVLPIYEALQLPHRYCSFRIAASASLLLRCFWLVSDMSKFHFEIEKLKKILLSNGYFNNFIDKCISNFMNKLYIKQPVTLTVPKKQLYLKMQALVKSGLARSLHKRLPFCKVKIVFKTSNRLKNYLVLKMLFLNLYVLAKFIILRAEAAMLHILVKPLVT